jgi:PPOX class probable F420-dependent enzyme
MVSRLYRWSIDATLGEDSAWVDIGRDGLIVDGHIVAGLPEPHTVEYELEVDGDLVTRTMTVRVRRASGASAIDLRNLAGRWVVDGVARPDLDGALDVDLAGCPLTNVMPIRRHDLVRREGSHELLMAFVEVPELRVIPDRQRYTHVRSQADGAIVRYESGDFRSDLSVDAEGFVIDYPRLGRRTDPILISIDVGSPAFISERRTATLATISPSGRPRLVPICFVIEEHAMDVPRIHVWSPLDAKPKRSGDVRHLARVRDIAARPQVTLLFERWSEDWSRLAWSRADGLATLVEPTDDGEAHRRAVEALRGKYPQYRDQPIDHLPMIRIAVTGTSRWQATEPTERIPGRAI